MHLNFREHAVYDLGCIRVELRPVSSRASLRLMRVSEIASRLTGISTPIAGISWTPPTPDVEVARKVLIFLEDRRVLYNPLEAEVAEYCVSSVLDIRQFLTDVLAEQGIGDDLAEHIRAMRAACRSFLRWFSAADDPSKLILPYGGRGSLEDWRLNQALGELRAAFGLRVAQIAVKYGIDLEEELASLAYPVEVALPAEPDEEN